MRIFNTIANGGEVTILLYGDVGEGKKVDSGRVVSELLTLQTDYKKINVRINSNGGDVFSGMAIYNALRTSTADITIYVDGVAASIAGIIALCGKPLYMSPYAKLMLHSVSGGTWGNASELRELASVMDSLESDLARMIAVRCGASETEVKSRYFDTKDHWLSAEEAVSLKLADGIYAMDGVAGAVPETTEEIYNYFNNRLVRQPQNAREMALIDKMKGIASLSDAADEQEIVDKVKALENKATKVDALEKANAEYKSQLEAAKSKEIDAIVNKALSEGKVSQDQVPALKALLVSDKANAEALLSGMRVKSKPLVSAYIREGERVDDSWSGKSWDEIDKAGKLSELKATNAALFGAKFKEKFGVDYKE